jgi:hypothetical protein
LPPPPDNSSRPNWVQELRTRKPCLLSEQLCPS